MNKCNIIIGIGFLKLLVTLLGVVPRKASRITVSLRGTAAATETCVITCKANMFDILLA